MTANGIGLLVQLRAGDLSLGLAPALGGSVSYFRKGEADLMRALTPEAHRRGDILGVAMFPMVPFANRIAQNRFNWAGREWHFAPNLPSLPLHVHGSGWTSSWDIHQDGADQALLSLEHCAADEPYSYRATQHFLLDTHRLTVTLALTNIGPFEMPFGFGLHPWFERDADTSLRFTASEFWLQGADGVASDPITIPPELDFSKGQALPTGWRDNNYGGWQGFAAIRHPSRGLGMDIEADPIFSNLMLYADPEMDFFCIEPQSHVPSAFNKPGRTTDPRLGTIVLKHGESMKGSVSFTPVLA